MSSTPTAKTFHYGALDGLRGVAAVAVVATHASGFLGSFQPLSAYLAVDFFFVLSGFVIAHAYDHRLSSKMSGREFFLRRILRLYPLYLAGSAIAIIGVVIAVFVLHDARQWTGITLLIAVLQATLVLPCAVNADLFPLNSPSWSLFFEFLANGVYATRIWQSGWLIWLVPAVAGVGLLVEAIVCGTLNNGEAWVRPWWSTLVWGTFRVAYSFPVGVLLYRYRNAVRVPRFHIAALAVILATLLWLDPQGIWRPLFDTIFVTVISPTIVMIGCYSEPKSPHLIAACRFLGSISYAIYVLHLPIINIVNGAVRRALHGPIGPEWQPWLGLALLAVLVAIAALADMTDQLVRHDWLTRGKPAKVTPSSA